MPTVRFAHSPKRPYYLPKFRQAEIHYHCMQLPAWERELQELDGHITAVNYDRTGSSSGSYSDKTAETACRRYVLERRINMIKETAEQVDPYFSRWIIENVTTGRTFCNLIVRDGIPACEKTLYSLRKQFYFILSKKMEKLEEHYA